MPPQLATTAHLLGLSSPQAATCEHYHINLGNQLLAGGTFCCQNWFHIDYMLRSNVSNQSQIADCKRGGGGGGGVWVVNSHGLPDR